MAAVLLTNDLVFSSKVAGGAMRQGIRVETALSVAALLEKVQAADVRLVMLDLTAAGLDPRVLVPQLRAAASSACKVLAFGPHVHEAKLETARAAGCELVLSRGQFNAQLDQILLDHAAG